jgi:hypothetical protein
MAVSLSEIGVSEKGTPDLPFLARSDFTEKSLHYFVKTSFALGYNALFLYSSKKS